eukprot:Gb_28915 [translate_table: standard]
MESRSRSSAPVLPFSSLGFQRSLSPTRHFSHSSPSSAFNFGVHRSLSPTRVNLYGASPSSASSVNFALDRSVSPSRTLQTRTQVIPLSPKGAVPRKQIPSIPPKRTCMCSPTTHPGSFRCSLHRNVSSAPPPQSRLHARRSAMTNSLVRICTVEGELVKRALSALIRPSSHQARRRVDRILCIRKPSPASFPFTCVDESSTARSREETIAGSADAAVRTRDLLSLCSGLRISEPYGPFQINCRLPLPVSRLAMSSRRLNKHDLLNDNGKQSHSVRQGGLCARADVRDQQLAAGGTVELAQCLSKATLQSATCYKLLAA